MHAYTIILIAVHVHGHTYMQGKKKLSHTGEYDRPLRYNQIVNHALA